MKHFRKCVSMFSVNHNNFQMKYKKIVSLSISVPIWHSPAVYVTHTHTHSPAPLLCSEELHSI